jgi:anti-anti-sigma factor
MARGARAGPGYEVAGACAVSRACKTGCVQGPYNRHARATDDREVIRKAARSRRLRPGSDIIIDLAGLEFIDSSGVATLLRGRRQARRAGGELLLAAPQQQALRVLTLTRLIDVFAVHASVAEAVDSAGHSPRVVVTVL